MKNRTNSKIVKDAIRLHLIEISQNDNEEIKTVEQAKKYIINKFYVEIIKYDKHFTNNIKVMSYQEIFAKWLNGLALHTYFTYHDIKKYLDKLNVNYKEEEPEKTYYYLIFKEIQKDLFDFLSKKI